MTKLAIVSAVGIHDGYTGKTYDNRRQDVLDWHGGLPDDAPDAFHDLQHLFSKMERAEKRYDIRTARAFKCSLPGGLPFQGLIQIISKDLSGTGIQRLDHPEEAGTRQVRFVHAQLPCRCKTLPTLSV